MTQRRLAAFVVALTLTARLAVADPRGIPNQTISTGAVSHVYNSPATTSRVTAWRQYRSKNFAVYAQLSPAQLQHVASQLESLRSQMLVQWSGASSAHWSPVCTVVVHGSQASYSAAVGPGGQMTTGSSLTEARGNRVVSRRIDILGDRANWLVETVPHELTHVVVADRFAGSTLPRWADEGMAIAADSEQKRWRHRLDLCQACEQGLQFRLSELLCMTDYPQPERFAAFYAQSGALIEFFLERGDGQTFIKFIQQAGTAGYDRALRSCYQIDGMRDLARQWEPHLSLLVSKTRGSMQSSRQLAYVAAGQPGLARGTAFANVPQGSLDPRKEVRGLVALQASGRNASLVPVP